MNLRDLESLQKIHAVYGERPFLSREVQHLLNNRMELKKLHNFGYLERQLLPGKGARTYLYRIKEGII